MSTRTQFPVPVMEAKGKTETTIETLRFDIDPALIDRTFQVPWSVDFLSGLVARLPKLMQKLGDLETRSLAAELSEVSIQKPIYIAGIARSGSTILLEALNQHSLTASHQYRDYPFLHFPYWWNQSQQGSQPGVPAERAHGDGIAVTDESPEAMEEVLWQSFFPEIHNPLKDQTLDAETTHPKFEQFYLDHLRKLLLIRKGQRYLSKGNYNLSRLGYIQKLFPDARFIIPVRRPEFHIASLMKQHRLFTLGETKHPRALKHMQRVGHYEFGLDRRPVNVGNTAMIREIMDLWETGNSVRGWARYWSYLYGWLADQLDANPNLRGAVEIVRYEDLCEKPLETISRISDHCDLPACDQVTEFAGRIHAPTYYRAKFSDEELMIIHAETERTAARFQYID